MDAFYTDTPLDVLNARTETAQWRQAFHCKALSRNSSLAIATGPDSNT